VVSSRSAEALGFPTKHANILELLGLQHTSLPGQK
jgi:hypothetical protein